MQLEAFSKHSRLGVPFRRVAPSSFVSFGASCAADSKSLILVAMMT